MMRIFLTSVFPTDLKSENRLALSHRVLKKTVDIPFSIYAKYMIRGGCREGLSSGEWEGLGKVRTVLRFVYMLISNLKTV